MTSTFTLTELNAASHEAALQMLDGLYEHTPWIAQQALTMRPFATAALLKYAMASVLESAGTQAHIALVRAHPELAGKALVNDSLTAESAHEQSRAGLAHCTPEEFATLHRLNAAYNAKFGFPFVLAVRGPRGLGLNRSEIIATFERRLHNPLELELAEALRNIHRIAELRLNDKLGYQPERGNAVWDALEALAQHSEPGYAEHGQLTVTYLTAAHQAVAQDIAKAMRVNGFDAVNIDAVGNVVGTYRADSAPSSSKTLLTGSHYDTVRNAGKHDGRLGVYVPIASVKALADKGQRLPFAIEVVAFAEEEGQRFKAAFLGASALTGTFDKRWLEQLDADGITMRQAMHSAGHNPLEIAALQRNPAQYIGFVEVHIEQGPVLQSQDMPLGIVTSINGSLRLQCSAFGMACHAGTTPMHRRADAALAVAELALFAEKRALADGDSVATMGMCTVENGSVNVVPGCCHFTLDMRAPNDVQRDAMAADIALEMARISAQRGVRFTSLEMLRAAAAPSDAALQKRWEAAVATTGLPAYRLPSGAGHDAMELHKTMPQAMLFVRGQNAGISHNPLESTTSCDIQLAIEAFDALLLGLGSPTQAVG